jgi:3-oxoacyl-[acyl-carrier protein] reductase
VDLGLRDRAAIITGASRGIGRQVALDLAADGCNVVLCARDRAALEGVAAEVDARGSTAVVVPIDVTVTEAADAIVTECQRAFGRVDILVNNAGGALSQRLDRLNDADWRAGFEVNFFAAARLALACAVVMRDAGWGRIINVASTFGVEPDPVFAPYSAAKAALINLSKSFALQFSSAGVLTNCVIPGVTMTEMVESNAAASAERMGTTKDDVMAKVMAKQHVAAGRFGQPEEISAAILFLASEQASWITGAALAIDGGTLRAT